MPQDRHIAWNRKLGSARGLEVIADSEESNIDYSSDNESIGDEEGMEKIQKGKQDTIANKPDTRARRRNKGINKGCKTTVAASTTTQRNKKNH